MTLASSRSFAVNPGAALSTGSPCGTRSALVIPSFASIASMRTSSRPFWRSSWNARYSVNEARPAAIQASTVVTESTATGWTAAAATAASEVSGSSQTMNAAMAARTMLRDTVVQPTGRECSWPKQWQSGLRPRARLTAIAAIKTMSVANVATAAQRAVGETINVAAQASSHSGSSQATGRAKSDGTPKSTIDCAVPARSESLATPAIVNTAASNSRATSKSAGIFAF